MSLKSDRNAGTGALHPTGTTLRKTITIMRTSTFVCCKKSNIILF